MLMSLVHKVSERARKKRKELFLSYMNPCNDNIILDLGSEDGTHISSIIPYRKNVYISDVSYKFLRSGMEKYGYKSVLIPEKGFLPFKDKSFAIVNCSSVIEHVSVEKDNLYYYKNWKDFRKEAFENQKRFAGEIRRIAKTILFRLLINISLLNLTLCCLL